MKKLLFVLLLAVPAFGQSFYRLPSPLPNAVLRVCPVPSGGNPCPSPIAIFADQGLSSPITQPVTLGVTGQFGFWVSSSVAQATIQVAAPYSLENIVSFGGGGGGTPGGSNLQPQFNNASTFGGVPNSLVDATTGRWALNNVGNSRYVTPAYNWSFAPGGSYTGGSGATLTFNGSAPNNVCPLGVNGADANLQVYISGGTGTAEVAAVTGGTCTPGLASGTLTFTPTNSHSGAFTVGSASQGIYEAFKDAGNNNGNVYLWPSGTTASAQTFVYTIQGTITIPFANMTLWGGGATLSCNSRGPCIKVPSAGNGFSIYNLRFSAALTPQSATISNLSCSSNTATFTVGNGSGQIVTGDVVMIQKTANSRYWGGPWGPVTANATTVTFSDPGCSVASTPSPGYMIIDNDAVESSPNNPGTHITDIELNQLGGATGAFSNGLVALNDQDFRVTGSNLNGLGTAAAVCQAGNYCGAAIFAPGPFSTNPAVIDVSHSNISMNCKGDGIVDWGGNSLTVDATIVQGTSTTGIFAGPIRGGLVGTLISGLYQENGGTCTNPDYPSGSAGQGIMDYGRPIVISGTIGTNGLVPSLSGFTSGSQQYWYWIVWHDSGGAVSRPMLAATAFSSTGTGTPVVIWPRVMDVATTTYDVLRTAASGPGFLATPTTGNCAGGSPLACGSVATAQAQCNTLTCSFTDNLANNTSSYVVPTSANTSSPTLWFWPGDVIVQNGGSVNNLQVNTALAVTPPGSAVNLNGSDIPTGVPSLASSYANYRTTHNYMSATLIPNSSGGAGRGVNANESLKGRLNLYASATIGTDEFSDLITLVDSTPEVTLTDPAQRPLASVGDMAIGTDTSGNITASGLSLRSPVSISNYINTLPDGSSWLERLTSAAKTLKVNTTIQANLTVTGTCTGCLGAGNGAAPLTATVYLSPNCPTGNTGGCYQTPANTQIVQNCTFNTGTANVVCASGTFASTDVGKYIWGWATCNPFTTQPTTIYITTTHNTISAFVSSSTVTMNAVGAAGSTTTGCVIFGSPDDTAAAAVDTAFASLSTTPFCPKLEMAAGGYLFTTPHFFTNPVGCAANPGQAGGGALGNMFYAAGFEVEGRGPGAAVWFLPPDFPESGTCTHGVGSTSCFAVPLEGRFSNFQITGGNGKAGGTSMPNGSSIINVDVGSLDYFTCTGMADLQSGFSHIGVLLTHWAQLNQVNISACGDVNMQAAGSTSGTGIRVSLEVANGINASSSNLDMATGADFTCYDCKFFGQQSAVPMSNIVAVGATTLRLYHPSISTGTGSSQFGYQCLTTLGCNLMVQDGVWATQGTAALGIYCGVTCTVDLLRSKVVGLGASAPLNLASGSTLINRGGNTFTGGAANVLSGVNVLNLDAQGATAISAAKAVLSGGWGNTPTAAWSSLNGGNSFTGTITNGTVGLGASPTITYTFPTPYLSTPNICQAVQIGGTNATGTFAPSSLSATGVTFTFSLTPTASATEIVQVFCQ